MSPTVQNKEVVESEHVIHSANHQSSSSAQTPQIGASYSTSPIPFSSHSVPLQTSVSNVASLQPSTSQVSTSQVSWGYQSLSLCNFFKKNSAI